MTCSTTCEIHKLHSHFCIDLFCPSWTPRHLAFGAEEQSDYGIPYQTVADYIHDIIEADRTLYTTHVVDRMQETGTAIASEGWRERNALPLPAQMLLLSGERVRKQGQGAQLSTSKLVAHL